jgi:hypothetical protein
MDTGMKWLFCILVALPILSWGQENLVPNGGFENHSGCPWTSAQLTFAEYWLNPNQASPDYFNACSTIDHISPPDVIYGVQYPHSGDAFTGVYSFYRGQPELREYLQIELIENLAPSVRYQVSFYVSPADDARYSISSMGAYLSVDTIYSNGFSVFNVVPQILNPTGNQLVDLDSWTLITDTFSSRTGGGEKFITIGNFKSDGESDTLLSNPTGGDANYVFAYYYIDDVSVIALDSIPNSIAEPATELALTLTVWPNPATSLLHIRSGQPLARLRLLDLSGRAVHAQEAQGTTHTIPLHTLPAGLYLLEAEDTAGRKAVQRVVKVTGAEE